MSNGALLKKLLAAESLLKQTTRGYAPDRPYWKRAMPLLWEVRLSLSGTDDGQDLAEAHGLLKQTVHGYDPRASRWKTAMEKIDWVEAGLQPPPIPYLGSTTRGGKSLLLEQLTHKTANIQQSGQPSNYPAFDFGWEAGLEILAPEPLVVSRQSSAMGADAFYADGQSTIGYWFGHLVKAPVNGTRFKSGEAVGRIAAIPGADHAHLGVNAMPLIDHDLLWGRKGNGPDYTFGSPTVGAQLTKALAL